MCVCMCVFVYNKSGRESVCLCARVLYRKREIVCRERERERERKGGWRGEAVWMRFKVQGGL